MPRSKPIRIGLAALGGLLILVALSVDGFPPGGLGTFGRVQWLFILAGAALMFVSSAWARAGERYRDGAAMLVTVFLLLLVAELVAGPARRLFQNRAQVDSHGAAVRRQDLSYIAGTDWAEAFWPEHRRAEADLRYQPYVLWRTAPFAGALTTVTPEGYRLTPGTTCTEASTRVFVFGGSTVWGWGVPDWGTIPAYLQAAWQGGASPVCTVNMGQNGFVSTQEIIALIRVLQQGQVPDLVIFYDGFNDVHAAFETGQPGVHYAPERIAEKLEDAAPPSLTSQLLARSDLMALLGDLKGRATTVDEAPAPLGNPLADSLRASIVHTYFSNVDLVALLAGAYGFEYLVAWQPSIYSDGGGLSDEEQAMYDRGMTQGFVPLLEAVGASVAERAAWDRHLVVLSNAFDQTTQPIWQDFVHPVPEGNRILAQRIIEALATAGLRAPEVQGP